MIITLKEFRIKKLIVLAATLLIAVGITACGNNKPASNKTTAAKTSSTAVKKSSENSKDSPSENKTGKTTTRIPVLMYHSINYEKGNILRVPKEKFAAQMKWLYDNGYKTLSLDELYNAVSQNKPIPEKSVVLTFDDGYGDNYYDAFPVIKQYHFKATVFMITSDIDKAKDNYLTADQLKEMDAGGMRIECHTVTHPDLSTLSYKSQYKQLSDSKTALENLLGHSIDYIAYPSGKYNDNTIKAAQQLNYKLCFKMKGGVGSITDNRYEFPRAFVGEDLQDIIKIVQG